MAVAYAARHPDRVSKLVLCSAYARGRGARAVSEEEKRAAALDLDLARVGWGRDDPAFRQVFAAQFLPDGTRADWAAFDQLQRRTTSPENAVRFLEEFARIDVRDEAGQVSCPTLIMHSRDDHRVPMRFGEELAALIPDSRLVALDSNNHLLTAAEPAWQVFRDEVEASWRSDIVLPDQGHQISTQSPHILHVLPARADPCWSHEKAPPHPAPGCHRDLRAWAPCPLARAARRPKRRQPRRRRPSAAARNRRDRSRSRRKYIADMKTADGKPMTIGIAVDGDQIAAYACNGTDDEAWFFGNQKDGKIDITSQVPGHPEGRVRRQGRGRRPDHERRRYKFSAPPVSAPAGMYTAESRRRARVLGGAARRQRHRRAVQRRYQRPRLRAGRVAAAQRTAVPQQRAQQAATAAGPADRRCWRTARRARQSTATR